MSDAKKIKLNIEALCVYEVKGDPVISALYELAGSAETEAVVENYARLYKAVAPFKSLKHYIEGLILENDNAFTRTACSGEALSGELLTAVKLDLQKLNEISLINKAFIYGSIKDEALKFTLETMPELPVSTDEMKVLKGDWENCTPELINFHRQNGFGVFVNHKAFGWKGEKLLPIKSVNPITLSDLKRYDSQKAQVVDNTESFLKGLPANNILLYGDRGTGKSSTVHAILNEYAREGLRLVEISKAEISELTKIREALENIPLKFIIFIDDLSFDKEDNAFGALKSALEGSLVNKAVNTLIYATSNRRHLIRESFSDRQNDVNRNDILQEQLSLSDRFGLTITYVNPGKSGYLDIVEKIAEDRGLNVNTEHLFFVAEQWATKKGGRSPRCAKQFVDFVESAEKRGKAW